MGAGIMTMLSPLVQAHPGTTTILPGGTKPIAVGLVAAAAIGIVILAVAKKKKYI